MVVCSLIYVYLLNENIRIGYLEIMNEIFVKKKEFGIATKHSSIKNINI